MTIRVLGTSIAAALVVIAMIGCSKHEVEPAVQPSAPTETAAQFQARRDAEVARQVAENLAKRDADEAAEEATENQKVAAQNAALIEKYENLVRANLKDPDSARFSDLVLTPTGDALCGNINARNGFGGYTGIGPFVATGGVAFIGTNDNRAMLRQVQRAKGCPE